MARKRKAQTKNQVERHYDEASLRLHIRQLGLDTVEAYQAWCRNHGLDPALDKSEAQRRQELSRLQGIAMQARHKAIRRLRRDPLDVLIAVCDGQLESDNLLQVEFEHFLAILNRRGRLGEPAIDRQVLKRLLTHLAKVRCKLLDDVLRQATRPGEDGYIEAIARLAAHAPSWLRPPETWRPSSKNVRRQFLSLTQHLLARYEVPAFFNSVWFDSRHRMAPRYRSWYVHLAQGGRLRDCTLPIAYTKRMAHCLMQAPDDITVSQAIRWGQVLGLGGDARLARALVNTRLGERFDHDGFWIGVVRWFVAHPMLDPAHVHPIVDYLHHQRFVSVDVQVGEHLQRRPLQPNLSMKGRTPATLLRQMEGWHHRLSYRPPVTVDQWQASGLSGLWFNEGQRRTASWRQWSIRELLTARALMAEGHAMQHCVASYALSCARGSSSIWTLECRSLEGQKKCVTIEVRPRSRHICQIRGHMNRLATEQELRVVRRWAEQEDLHLAAYVG